MSDNHLPLAVEDEVAAKLQDVFALVRLLDAVALPHSACVAPQTPRLEERQPTRAFQTKRGVCVAFGVADDGHRPLLPRDVKREHFRFCLRDDKNGATECRELVACGVHLTEVGVARDSREVPQKNEEQEIGCTEFRQPDRVSIRLQKRKIRSRLAGNHFFTRSKTNVTFPVSLNSFGRSVPSSPVQIVSLSLSSL